MSRWQYCFVLTYPFELRRSCSVVPKQLLYARHQERDFHTNNEKAITLSPDYLFRAFVCEAW